MKKETTGQIIPAYDGNFSNKMVWDEERLTQICKSADLRTKIYVKAGDLGPDRQQENLGEVLAWKQIFDPRELLKLAIDDKGFVDTSNNATSEESVYINYLRVTDYIQNKSSGRFDERLFVKTFDRLAKKGISNILAKEKLLLTGISSAFLGMDLFAYGLLGGVAYLGFSGTVTDRIFAPPTVSFGFSYESSHQYLEYAIGRLASTTIGLEALVTMLKISKLKTDYDGVFFKTRQDRYNPLKHIVNFAVGQIALREKPIVSYQE